MADAADMAAVADGIAIRVLNRWLGRAKPGDRAIYHRGELARDKAGDPQLAELAEELLKLSNGRFDVVSECGHVRDEIIGTRRVELLTRRSGGETGYLVERRAG